MSKPKVLVAMSGGVDSSVAALLLLQQGYQVVGATLNLWSYEGREEPYNECCSLEVKTVAQQLGIEHHWVDEGIDFKAAVVDPFIDDYLAGMTPSPCGRCNRLIRFPKLLGLADKLECELLATGHHASVQERNGEFTLHKGSDPFKDQSYYMYALNQEQLSRVFFPVGHLNKSEVWRIAEEHNLVSARKPESQDLCFLPMGDLRNYLKQHSNGSLKPGEIVDSDGHILGRHEGLAFYTIGQRRGLDVAVGYKIYVIALDFEKNQVVVGPRDALFSNGLTADQIEFISGKSPEEQLDVDVKIRYRSPAVSGRLSLDDSGMIATVLFETPQRAVTPGQLAVFYEDDRVIGGGRILSSIRESEPAPIRSS